VVAIHERAHQFLDKENGGSHLHLILNLVIKDHDYLLQRSSLS
jgi:hypothetical protein